jgi:hypothetical protein
MHIYIDESGIFRKPLNKTNVASCLAALVIPSSAKVKLIKDFVELSSSWPRENGEVKGRLLDEDQIATTVELLRWYDALLEVNAIDLGIHTEAEITRIKTNMANIMFGWATPGHPLRERFLEIANAYQRTSNQLFVEAFLMQTLLPRVIQNAINYYARRIPKELASFHWVVDAKETTLTQFESAWSDAIFPSVAFQSQSEPFTDIPGGDYSYLERFINRTDEVVEGIERKTGLPRDEIAGLSLKELLGKSFKFQDSKDKPGLQLVDIVVNALQRAFNGRLRQEGWEGIGSLMIERPLQVVPFILMENRHGIGGTPRRINSPFAPVVDVLNRRAKPMRLDPAQEAYLFRK